MKDARVGRVLTLPQLLEALPATRKGRRVVFTNGCFDILHVGHVRYLQEARALGDILVLGLNSDASVRKLKGESRPVQNENERGEILAALGCVDFVVIFGEETPLELVKKVSPDVLVKGGDWTVDKIVGSKEVLAAGGEVKSLKFHPGRSTSLILERIQKL